MRVASPDPPPERDVRNNGTPLAPRHWKAGLRDRYTFSTSCSEHSTFAMSYSRRTLAVGEGSEGMGAQHM